MMRKTTVSLAVASAVLLFVVVPPWGTASSQPPQEVLVTNLPNVVHIEGRVGIAGTTQHSRTFRRLNLVVPPVDRHKTSDLIEVEEIPTDGFTQVTLSLHGAVRGTIGRPGEVGVILVPEEVSVLEMMREKGIFHFPVEVKVSLKEQVSEAAFSVQRQLVLGFPKYKVFLYNSTDRTVDAHVFVYLTN